MPWPHTARKRSLEIRRANAETKRKAQADVQLPTNDREAAAMLAQGSTKSVPVPVHPGAQGRQGRT